MICTIQLNNAYWQKFSVFHLCMLILYLISLSVSVYDKNVKLEFLRLVNDMFTTFYLFICDFLWICFNVKKLFCNEPHKRVTQDWQTSFNFNEYCLVYVLNIIEIFVEGYGKIFE